LSTSISVSEISTMIQTIRKNWICYRSTAYSRAKKYRNIIKYLFF